jgi:GH24 family phage-related lysozyme (muramidase)
MIEAIGKGFELQITETFAGALLDVDVSTAIAIARAIWPAFEEYEPARQTALISICFQMGDISDPGPNNFQRLIHFTKARDWSAASDEVLWTNGTLKGQHTPYYQQCQARAQETSMMLATGRFQENEEPNNDQSA